MDTDHSTGLASGYWNSLADLQRNHQVGQTWQPDMPLPQRDTLYAKWQKAVEKSMGWAVG